MNRGEKGERERQAERAVSDLCWHIPNALRKVTQSKLSQKFASNVSGVVALNSCNARKLDVYMQSARIASILNSSTTASERHTQAQKKTTMFIVPEPN